MAFIIDDIINAIGAAEAARQQEAAAKKAMGVADQIWLDQRRQQTPYIDAGRTSLADLLRLKDDPNAIQNSPAFQFRLAEGQKALERSAAARGGLSSGRFMKDLGRFSQGLASEEYGNQWNRLFGLSEMGRGAATTLGNFGSTHADRIAQLFGAQGNAQAAGTKAAYGGGANAFASAANLAMLGLGGGFGGLAGLGGAGAGAIPTQAAALTSGYAPTANFNLPQLAFGGR